jgi:serine/threonine protein kinase
MGAIYLGKQVSTNGFDKDVVLKQLLPEYTTNQAFIELFLHEARITASLDHANIVHTIDLVAADADLFIVMEYVEGSDLRMLLRRAKLRGHRFSPAAALYTGRCLLDALAYAYSRRDAKGEPLLLIHRDISPSNILISGAGEVKLSDFGVAKAATQNTVSHRVTGKIGYMSPEQARGEPVDHRSDLYSLAVCIYESLVGERLFVGDLTSSPSMIYSQPVRPPSQARLGLPRELDAVFARALALAPADRFQSADQFQEALDRIIYRYCLAYSAQEMAVHLREVCGEVRHWRSLENDIGQPTGTAVLEGDEAARRGGVTFFTGVSGLGDRLTQNTGWDTPSWALGAPAETTHGGEAVTGVALTGDFGPGGEPSFRIGKPLAEGTQLRSILGLAPLGDEAPPLLRIDSAAGVDATPSLVLNDPTQVSADPMASLPAPLVRSQEFDELLLDGQSDDAGDGGLEERTLPQGPEGLATDLELHDDDRAAEAHDDEPTSTFLSLSPRGESLEEEIPALGPPPVSTTPASPDPALPRTRKADSLGGFRNSVIYVPPPAASPDVGTSPPMASKPRDSRLPLIVAVILLGIPVAIFIYLRLM